MNSKSRKGKARKPDDLPPEFWKLADEIGIAGACEVASEVLRLVQTRRLTVRQIARRVGRRAWRRYGPKGGAK